MKREHQRTATVALCTIGCLAALGGCRPQTDTTPPVTPDAPLADGGSNAAVWPDEDFRARQPPPREVPETTIPEVEQFTLDNGLEVYLVRETRLPVFSMSLQFDVGAAGDPASKPGRTDLCMDLIDEGTKKLDKPAFEGKQAEHAVSIWTSGGQETSTANARGLTTEFGPAMALFSDMLRQPGLRSGDLDRLQSQRKAMLTQTKASARGAGYIVFDRYVWGASHPFGAVENDATVDAISLSDCNKVARKLRPGGARLFVYGKLDEAAVRKAFDENFGGWKGKQGQDKKPPAAKPDTAAIYIVDVPDSAQSQIVVGYPGPRRDAPDFVATDVMTGVFGGGFTSRLNMNLREDKGYAYGARGGFSYTRDASVMRAASSVETATTGASLVEIQRELAGMLENPPSEEELAREKASALLTMPARYATASDALSRFRSLVYYGLPVNWDETYQDQVRALELAQVHAAAGKYVRTKDLTVVVAGDKATIGPQIEKLAKQPGGILGAKRVVYVDADGNPE